MIKLLDKQLLNEGAQQVYLKNAQALGAFGFKDLDICLYVHPAHPNTHLANIEGFGHSAWILYIYESLPTADIALSTEQFFNDFTQFILWERDQEHETQH